MLPRLIAVALVAIEAVVLGLMTGAWIMPIVLAAVAVAGAFLRIRFNPAQDQRVLLGLALSMPFLVWYVVYLAGENIDTTLLDSNIGVLMGQFFLGLQVMQFFLRHKNGMPPVLPLFGVVTLTFAGDVALYSDIELKTTYFVLTLCFAALSACYFSMLHPRLEAKTKFPRRGRSAWLGATLLLALLLAWSTARFIEYIKSPLEQWAGNLILQTPPLTLINKDVARLGSIPKYKKEQGEHIALHVVSDSVPGYLRTRAFEEFKASEWHYHGTQERVPPRSSRPAAVPEIAVPGPYFPVDLSGRGAPGGRVIEIFPERDIRTAMHTPAETAWLSMEDDVLLVDEFGIPEAAGNLEGRGYTAFAHHNPPPRRMSEAERARFLQLPEGLDPKIHARARDVCSGRDTVLEKIAAVTQYFTNRYRYDLGIDPPFGRDPMDYFLLEEPPPAAHCEYFASGAALFLRSAGVPCRYVTGVVAWERSKLGDYWIVRNRDAHAWVEAFVTEDGTPDGFGAWRVVEATPADGLPEADEEKRGGPIGDFIDALRFHLARLSETIKRGDWMAGLRAAFAFLGVPLRWLLLTWTGWLSLALMAWPMWRVAKARGWTLRGARRRRPDPRIEALAKLLRSADKLLKRRGLTRARGETLHAFARRAEAEGANVYAAWYRDYARCRYGAPITAEAIAELEAALPAQ